MSSSLVASVLRQSGIGPITYKKINGPPLRLFKPYFVDSWLSFEDHCIAVKSEDSLRGNKYKEKNIKFCGIF